MNLQQEAAPVRRRLSCSPKNRPRRARAIKKKPALQCPLLKGREYRPGKGNTRLFLSHCSDLLLAMPFVKPSSPGIYYEFVTFSLKLIYVLIMSKI